MPLFTIIVVLLVAGIILWLINNFIPMDAKVKKILNIVVVVLIIIWLLEAFGVFHILKSARI